MNQCVRGPLRRYQLPQTDSGRPGLGREGAGLWGGLVQTAHHLKSIKLDLHFLISIKTALVWRQKTKVKYVKYVVEWKMTSYSKNN